MRPSATVGEAAFVLGLPITLFFSGPLWRLLAGGQLEMRPAITDTRLLTVLGAEVVLAIILLVWLRGRGWRLGGEIGWPSWGDALRGVGLWVATFCAGRLVMLATGALAPAIVGIAKATPLHGVLALLSVLPVALVFTAYFGRTRRLWPVVLAHVIVNAFGLSTFAGTGG